MKFEKEQLPKSQMAIKVELDSDELQAYREEAVADLAKGVKAEGFRPGHVPSQIAEKQIGESAILQEVAQRAISKTYGNIIQEEQIDVIGEPEIEILKLAPGNPFEFKITVAVLPEVTLPDYKKIASEASKKEVQVEEKEVEDALEWLKGSRKAQVTGEEHAHEEEGEASAEEKPSMSDDEFAQSVGGFENIAALKESIKEGLEHEKKAQEKDRFRQEILENIAADSTLEVPDMLVEREKEVLLNNIKNGVAQMLQISFEEYLKQSAKTEEELIESLAPEAEKRVKKFLVLREVAKRENIAVTKDEIEEEATNILKHYQNTEKAQQAIDPQRLREYTEGVIRHEKTLQFLEELSNV